ATAADYTFAATADNGLRFYVDGTPVIDQWGGTPGSWTGTASLTAGTHTLQVDYFEAWGGATAKASFAAVAGGVLTTAPLLSRSSRVTRRAASPLGRAPIAS